MSPKSDESVQDIDNDTELGLKCDATSQQHQKQTRSTFDDLQASTCHHSNFHTAEPLDGFLFTRRGGEYSVCEFLKRVREGCYLVTFG